MKIFLFCIYAAVLAVISFFTHEIVAYVLLGFILIALNNVLAVLKEISKKLDGKGIEQSGLKFQPLTKEDD